MNQINYSKNINLVPDKAQVEIAIAVNPQEYAKVWESAAAEYTKNVSKPGFRKGFVPEAQVKSEYFTQISEQAYNDMINFVVQDVVKEIEQKPISTVQIIVEEEPEHEHKEGETHDHDFKFSLRYAYRVDPKLADIEKIKVARPAVSVSEEEIKQSLDMLMKSVNEKRDADHANEDSELSEESDSTLTDPEAPEITTWTDEVVKLLKIDGVNTVDDLQALVKSEIEKQKNYEQEMLYRSQILDEIVKSSEVMYPELVMQDMLVQQEQEYKKRVEKLGFEYDKYLVEKNINMSDLKNDWIEMIKTDIARELILSQYAKETGLAPTEEEIDSAIKTADQQLKDKFSPEALRDYMKYIISNNMAFSKIYATVSQD